MPALHNARDRWLMGLAAAAGVLLVLVAIGTMVATTVRQDDRITELRADNVHMLRLAGATDAKTVTKRVIGGGRATIVSSRKLGTAVFASSGLPELPGSKGYALWLADTDDIRPAGMIGAGSGPQVLELGDANRLGLTIEPAKGSKRPTTEPLLVAELPD